jgi:hypothetical protein
MIKRLLKSVKDLTSYKKRKSKARDMSAKAVQRRKKARAYYVKNKVKIKASNKAKHAKLTSTEKKFNLERRKFLRSLRPKKPKK